MHYVRKLLFVYTVLALLCGVTAASRADDKVRVTYASADALYAPYFIGIEKGYFKQLGLDVELVQAGGGTATPALMSGNVDFSSSSGSAVSAIIKGAPLKVIMTLAVSLPWKMWATTPDVKSLQDLKGKPIGVETRGGLDELATRAALMKAGLPQDWVIYSPIGVGGIQRVATVQSASMPAVFLSYYEEKMARANNALKNAHVLINFAGNIDIPYNGLATSQAMIDKNPKVVERFLKGVMMGVRYMKTHRDATVQILLKYNKVASQAVIEESFDETSPTVLVNGEATQELRDLDLKLRAEMMKAGTAPLLDKVYDYSFVKQAVAELKDWKPEQ
jgi:ABC-type nitrate/sulfonate/bicarbonate transport system substrate-binding protein